MIPRVHLPISGFLGHSEFTSHDKEPAQHLEDASKNARDTDKQDNLKSAGWTIHQKTNVNP